MTKKPCTKLAWILAAGIVTVDYGTKVPAQTPAPPDNSFSSYRSESQFIVQAVVSDLAEQVYYAAMHRLPDRKYFSISAMERPGAASAAPVFDLEINVDEKHTGLKVEVKLAGSIWSPVNYQAVTAALAEAVGLKAAAAKGTNDTGFPAKLLDGTAGSLEQENQALSEALEKDFTNPALHERAALLLGAFLLREHSGYFFEIRSPLSRLTAHLAMARFLAGPDSQGINGRLAEATLLTLENDETLALGLLKSVDTNNPGVAGLVRALRARNTGDHRALSQVTGRSQVESVAWFAALAGNISTAAAWPKLNDEQRQTIDFVRVANESGYSVGVGHQLLAEAIALELQEIQRVYELSRGKTLTMTGLTGALNELPERCFTDSGAETHVRIIGWGQWAMFLQRHLCHAIQQNFYFMNSQWGVPDDAKELAAKCDQVFGGLRLYPFVRRFNSTDAGTYRKSVDDGFKLTTTVPEMVPTECWNYLYYTVAFAPSYNPHPSPPMSRWYDHNPLPGTVYNLQPRLTHPSLVSRPDVIARFEQLHELAPYDLRVANFIINRKYTNRPSFDQAVALYKEVLPYSAVALRMVAGTVTDQPAQYEKFMVQAADLNPAYYYELGDYVLRQRDEDKAAQYIEKGCEADSDDVRIAGRAEWRVRYYLKKGQKDKAREIADFAGEVYSFAGLTAKAVFLEATTNYSGAFEWFAKIEDRYNDATPLMAFCMRYKALTGDTRFEEELQKRLKPLFPKGMEKVSLTDFHGPPTDGVLIEGQSALLLRSGLKPGTVIVAINGIRAHTVAQYNFTRDSLETPQLDMIYWQDNAYQEIHAVLPNRRFGVPLGDYKPK